MYRYTFIMRFLTVIITAFYKNRIFPNWKKKIKDREDVYFEPEMIKNRAVLEEIKSAHLLGFFYIGDKMYNINISKHEVV